MVVVMWLLDVMVEIVGLDGIIWIIFIEDLYLLFGDMFQYEIVLYLGEIIIVVILFVLVGGMQFYQKMWDWVFYVFVLVLVGLIWQVDGLGWVVLGGVVLKLWCSVDVDVDV